MNKISLELDRCQFAITLQSGISICKDEEHNTSTCNPKENIIGKEPQQSLTEKKTKLIVLYYNHSQMFFITTLKSVGERNVSLLNFKNE